MSSTPDDIQAQEPNEMTRKQLRKKQTKAGTVFQENDVLPVNTIQEEVLPTIYEAIPAQRMNDLKMKKKHTSSTPIEHMPYNDVPKRKSKKIVPKPIVDSDVSFTSHKRVTNNMIYEKTFDDSTLYEIKKLEEAADTSNVINKEVVILKEDLKKLEVERVNAEKDVKKSKQTKLSIDREVARSQKKPKEYAFATKMVNLHEKSLHEKEKNITEKSNALFEKENKLDANEKAFSDSAHKLKEVSFQMFHESDESSQIRLDKEVNPIVPKIVKQCEFSDWSILGKLKKMDVLDEEYSCIGFSTCKHGEDTILGTVRCKPINDICPTTLDQTTCKVVPFDMKSLENCSNIFK